MHERPRHSYWEKQFDNEKIPTKREEYESKINYDVWDDVVQFPNGQYKKLKDLPRNPYD
tara:strand:- start:3105 stop:3281 length:177 start_codon:yes stop_codon:yes gene_type:complete